MSETDKVIDGTDEGRDADDEEGPRLVADNVGLTVVNIGKSTRYALYAAMEMAVAGEREQVTAAQVAERYRLPATVVAKVLQQLVRAGIAVGTRGTGGGHQLARPPGELTVLDVIEVFEPQGAAGANDPRGAAGPLEQRLHDVFAEVDDLVRYTLASISLETLVSGRPPLAG